MAASGEGTDSHVHQIVLALPYASVSCLAAQEYGETHRIQAADDQTHKVSGVFHKSVCVRGGGEC